MSVTTSVSIWGSVTVAWPAQTSVTTAGVGSGSAEEAAGAAGVALGGTAGAARTTASSKAHMT